MNTHSGILPESVDKPTHWLNPVLFDELSLFLKTRRAHWYFDGPEKANRTLFFQRQYKQIEDILDSMISYISLPCHNPLFSLNSFLEASHAAGPLPATVKNLDPVSELLAEHKAIILKLRELLPCAGKAHNASAMTDFILDLIGAHEHMSGMLKDQ